MFDRNTEKRQDISVIVIAPPDDALVSIDNDGHGLVRGRDYTDFSAGVIIKADYLASIAVTGSGTARLFFNFNKGGRVPFDISIIDTTPYHAPPRPVAVRLDPAALSLAHASKFNLNDIKVTVSFEDGTNREVYSGISWRVIQGSGVITQNLYEPRDEDGERLECAYAQEGFEPVYGFMSVNYSDGKLVPVFKISATTANAGDTLTFDASESTGCDLYEWWFDLANIYDDPDESARVKYWSAEAKTNFIYGRGGVYRAALKIKNGANPHYVKSSPVSLISVRPLPPKTSPPAGSYEGVTTVIISAGSETGRIIYTLDGSAPSPSGNAKIYTGPIKLNASAVLRAIALVEESEKTAMIASEVMTARYNIFNNSNISPLELNFDRRSSSAAEMMVSLELNGNTLENLIYKDHALSRGSDYFVAEERLAFSEGFLKSLPDGTASVIFKFSAGADAVLSITVYQSYIIIEQVKPPELSVPPGVYNETFSVAISSATAGATIRYMLDGTTPTRENGTQYKKAFKLNASATVRAFAYKKDMPDSEISSAEYIINPAD